VCSSDLEVLISALQEEIKVLKADSEEEADHRFATYMFFNKDGKEHIISYVEFLYREHGEIAKEMVSSLHDDTFDLSTIPCCKDDFEPWEA
jgi:hypothetical protein